ncbi:MAG: hypothetical protein AB7G13_18470 [Lautropia sp.]
MRAMHGPAGDADLPAADPERDPAGDPSSREADAVLADLAAVFRCRCCLPRGLFSGRSGAAADAAADQDQDQDQDPEAGRPLRRRPLSRSDFLGPS